MNTSILKWKYRWFPNVCSVQYANDFPFTVVPFWIIFAIYNKRIKRIHSQLWAQGASMNFIKWNDLAFRNHWNKSKRAAWKKIAWNWLFSFEF